jgi:hypothetical protein
MRDGSLPTTLRDETLRGETLVRSQSVVARHVDGETLIVPANAKAGDLATVYSFNGTGAWIWEMLESSRTVSQLVKALAREYQVEPARAEHDVVEFVSEMKAVGLVEVAAVAAMAGD